MRDLCKRITSFPLTRMERAAVSVGAFGDKRYAYLQLSRVTLEGTLAPLGRRVHIPAEALDRLIAALCEARDKLASDPDTWGAERADGGSE
ncbi:hypothetical protein AQ962_03640 [Burkholderia pseudomallei]|uniref:hypothetical protein n=1 Tax=Burkholderia pseudomallei TaxID=28450 RepID=UPI0009760151|nr:hypothetical protein [Burkholderia pseudomallei]OMW13621.1 hypothetical protein AQ804_29975 [Burkholderia pseudomallei]OMW19931.1 hypothetical protein AQ805_02905 [Burkholderia pseudomallei]ONF14168.1 hypothetical protein AQ962_03640 [Burkholderia pseudomallei]ONF14248.1 hypothetical protein AQ961_22025 [Burkholderia pseudomallei]ONF19213.1 hypothetical protein AQ963_29405 [Burkholderia pseudomallei]